MNKFHLQFEAILDEWTNVNLKHGSLPTKTIEMYVDDNDLHLKHIKEKCTISSDIIDLAVAIFAADRVCIEDFFSLSREIQIDLPLRNPNIFNNSAIIDELKDLLNWGTGSIWTFNFLKRSNKRSVEKSSSITFPDDVQEVALWSGGLDAFAGLIQRKNKFYDKDFALIGTGASNLTFGKQKKARNILPNDIKDKTRLYQIPIRWRGVSKKDKDINRYMRSRGIVFALIGSVAAYNQKLTELFIYENGTGAFNLPYNSSSVGVDNARSIHPITLYKISILLSNLYNVNFKIHNPFIFSTKAQMLKTLPDEYKNLIKETISCDKPHRERPIQCGYCSSCLLRRQSIAAAGINDETSYNKLSVKLLDSGKKKYFDHMNNQVNRLSQILLSNSSMDSKWRNFTQLYPDLDDVVEILYESEGFSFTDTKKNIINLYKNYIEEWIFFEASLQ